MEWRQYTIEGIDEALMSFGVSRNGLSSEEALRRVKEWGPNALGESEHFFWRVLRRRLQSVLLWIFVVVGIITIFLENYFEAGFIFLFLGINFFVELYQEFHSEKAARLLQHYLVPRAQVIRDGKKQEILSTHIVPGDIVVLSLGDYIPADVRLLEVKGFGVNESLVTGESVTTPKITESLRVLPSEISAATNMAFTGTSVVTGSAIGVVIATGKNTALGDIAYLTAITEKETVFEKNVRDFSRFLVKMLLGSLGVIFLLYFITHGQSVSVTAFVVFALVLAVTVIPEALPAITTVALTRGALVLAKKQVVVKRLSAIEDLGSIELLCADKTGTLTENNLAVTNVWGEKETVLQYALLAAGEHVSLKTARDSFNKALCAAATKSMQAHLERYVCIEAVPFDPMTRMNSVLVKEQGTGKQIRIVRGAPEEILRRVDHVDSYTRNQIQQWVTAAGLRGERVLAVASQDGSGSGKAKGALGGGMQLVGLITFLDPIKTTAKATIAEARKLGVAVKIFSGDSREVVGAVAYVAGLITDPKDVITGSEFEALSLTEQITVVETKYAFARFSPTQKFEALQLLQKSHTVGFLGEGINDAPALKLANVALVVQGASDIAREASDILLLDRDLRVIIDGIKEGRRVFANILKYLKITLAANFGNFYSVTFAALFLPFLPLLPLQILLLNLLSDLPMLAISTDRVDHEKLEQPNKHNMHSILVVATLFGALSSLFDLTVFSLFAKDGAATLQTAWFIFSLITEVLLIFALRSRRWSFKSERPSSSLALLSGVTLIIAVVLPYSILGQWFGFLHVSMTTLGLLVSLALLSFVVIELVKRWYYEHRPQFL
jgi:Mg2+-importing ATPase